MNESYDDARGMLGDLSVAASRARQAIDPRGHRLLRVWGFVYLVGFGALWADITFRDGPSPVLGLACLGVAGLVGLASTTRELQRLHGLSGASQRAVRRLWTSWALTLVAWALVRPARQSSPRATSSRHDGDGFSSRCRPYRRLADGQPRPSLTKPYRPELGHCRADRTTNTLRRLRNALLVGHDLARTVRGVGHREASPSPARRCEPS